MKALVGTDFHVHSWQNFGKSDVKGMSKRLVEQEGVLNQIVDLAIAEKVKLFVFGGDLYHKVGEIPVPAMNVVDRFMKRLKDAGIDFAMAVGNHDISERRDPAGVQSAIQPYGDLETVEYCNDSIKVRLVHYHSMVDYEAIKGYDIVMVHKTPEGAKLPSYTFDEGVDWKRLASQNKMVFFGHIHHMQQLGPNAFVAGAPMHLTFGDEGPRGVWLVDGDDVTFKKLDYPEFVTVDTEEEVKEDKNYYRVLHATKRSEQGNVVSVVVPEKYQERLTQQDFNSVLKEWLQLNEKTEKSLDVLRDILEEQSIDSKVFFKGRLVEVEMQDFISVGTAKYEVKKGFVLVDGENRDMNGSNGSGKSSMIGEAIYWALFGKTTKGLTGDDVLRRGGPKDCWVKVVLSDGDTYYEVIRTRRGGMGVTRFSPEDKIGETLTGSMRQADRQEVLENQLLGFGEALFLASCYFSQESLAMLTNLSDSDKTNMISTLLGFDVYDRLYVGVVEEIKNHKLMTGEFEDKKKEKDGELSVLREREAGVCDIINRCDEKVKEVENEKLGVRLVVSKLEKDLKELVDQPVDSKQLQDLLAGLKKAETELIGKVDSFRAASDKEKEVQVGFVSDRSKYGAVEQNVSRQIEKLEHEIEDLKTLKKGSICDKCGAEVTEENVGKFIEEKMDAIDVLKDELKLVEENVAMVENSIKLSKARIVELVDKESLVRDKIDKTKKEIEEVEGLIKEQEKKASEFAVKKAELEGEIKRQNFELSRLDDRIKEETNRKDTAKSQLKVVIDDQTSVSKSIEDIDNALVRVGKELEELEFWRTSFSAKGIRALLLDRFCNEFNELINDFLSAASSGAMSIQMSPTSQLKSGEERNKLGMDIRLMDDVVKYESLSGGEKRRVDVALCLSLNEWVARQYGIEGGLLGLVILDELFSFVDRVGEESIGTLLYHQGAKKAVFVVSHTPDLASYADRSYLVVKENGVSRLEERSVNGG